MPIVHSGGKEWGWQFPLSRCAKLPNKNIYDMHNKLDVDTRAGCEYTGGRWGSCIELNEEARLLTHNWVKEKGLILVETVSVGDQSSGHRTWGVGQEGESNDGCFLYILTLGPVKSFTG